MTQRDGYTASIFAWLGQVAADGSLPAIAVRLAIILVTRYLNRLSGTAWPAVATLARDLGVAERSIQRAIAVLAVRHLSVAIGGGRNATNQYRMKLESGEQKPRQTRQGFQGQKPRQPRHPLAQENPDSAVRVPERETLTSLSRKGDIPVAKTLTGMSPEPSEGTIIEPSESLVRDSDLFGEQAKTRKGASKRKTKSALNEAFAEWLKIYPKKDDPLDAQKAFAAALKKASLAELTAGAERYAAERQGEDPRYTKAPAKWLRAGSWANEPAAQPFAPHQARHRPGGTMSALRGIVGDDQ